MRGPGARCGGAYRVQPRVRPSPCSRRPLQRHKPLFTHSLSMESQGAAESKRMAVRDRRHAGRTRHGDRRRRACERACECVRGSAVQSPRSRWTRPPTHGRAAGRHGGPDAALAVHFVGEARGKQCDRHRDPSVSVAPAAAMEATPAAPIAQADRASQHDTEPSRRSIWRRHPTKRKPSRSRLSPS